MSATKLEYAVQMTCDSCGDTVRDAVRNREGVLSVTVNIAKESVIVETTLSSDVIKEYIESTGRRAVLMGLGSDKGYLGAAVAEMRGCGIKGVVRLVQLTQRVCLVEGVLDGLQPGQHLLSVNQYGDLTQGCASCGDVFQGPHFDKKDYGELTSLEPGDNGRATFRFESSVVQVWDVIGRSMVLQRQGASPERLACAIIARSSGIQQNPKRFCACDGIMLWDERDEPIAGPTRGQKKKIPS